MKIKSISKAGQKSVALWFSLVYNMTESTSCTCYIIISFLKRPFILCTQGGQATTKNASSEKKQQNDQTAVKKGKKTNMYASASWVVQVHYFPAGPRGTWRRKIWYYKVHSQLVVVLQQSCSIFLSKNMLSSLLKHCCRRFVPHHHHHRHHHAYIHTRNGVRNGVVTTHTRTVVRHNLRCRPALYIHTSICKYSVYLTKYKASNSVTSVMGNKVLNWYHKSFRE